MSYDTAGNLTQATYSQDGTRTVYFYDDADRLNRIEKRNSGNWPIQVSEFTYDYASRRASSREYVHNGTTWVQTENKTRVFDGLDVIQERNASNYITAQLVRDGNIGGILSRTTADGAAFYGYDGNGNVTLLTNSAGQDVAHYRYDAFGNTLETDGPRAGENPFRFSTKELHAQSGLVDFGYRFYSPGLGRWMNRDPLQEEGGINLYGAMGNNLVNNVDEYGLNWLSNLFDEGGRWVNDLLEPPKAKPIDGEDPAETTIREKKAIDKLVVSTGKTAVGTAYNGLYGELPKQLMAGSAVKGVGIVGSSVVPMWTRGRAASNAANAYRHWRAHGRQFPHLRNALQYARAAQRFVTSPPAGTLIKRRGGNTLFYHPASNTFAIRAPSGAPRTMFKPSAGRRYWNRQ